MAEDIRALSAALARDPSSLIYVELAEALRRRGKLQEAVQVALHGLGRHPEHADGYDCLARIQADRGELAEARATWERALAIAPEHGGALRGIGFLYYRQGDTRRASDALEHAVAADPSDAQARRALAILKGEAPAAPLPAEEPRRRTPADVPQLRATAAAMLALRERASIGAAPAPAEPPHPPAAPAEPARAPVFAGLEGATADMLLLDAHGLVMGGGLRAADGSDASELAAAALAGVSGEALRTGAYLGLGDWRAIVAEADHANVVLAPLDEGAMLLVRRDRSTAVGLALRIAERARVAAARWLEEQR